MTAFLTHGYVTIAGAIPPATVAAYTASLWPRLHASPTDRSTWTRERTFLPASRHEPLSTFAPAAWGAACDLLGGAGLVETAHASDAFIVNLGVPGSTPCATGRSLGGELWDWNVDGAEFVHFLDSREQALLAVPVFADVAPGGGATMVAPDGIARVARHLWAHPEGVQPRFSADGRRGWFVEQARACARFAELTAHRGDVVLVHPFMLHSASRNWARVPRVIANVRVALKRPFAYGRDGSALSLVEQKTLMALGLDSLGGWCIAGVRRAIVPERVRKLREEDERRKAAV